MVKAPKDRRNEANVLIYLFPFANMYHMPTIIIPISGSTVKNVV